VFQLLSSSNNTDVLTWTIELLTEVSAGNQRRAAVRHPLGFVCFPLIRNGAEGLCIHYWPDAADQLVDDSQLFHSHSWHLVSHVLLGTVVNEVAQLRSANRAVDELYDVMSDEYGDSIAPTGRLVNVQQVYSNTHYAGTWYRLAAGTFHRTRCTAGTVTAVAALDERSKRNLLVDRKGRPATRKPRARRPVPNTVALARKLLHLLPPATVVTK
jgi:hypothetical protein